MIYRDEIFNDNYEGIEEWAAELEAADFDFDKLKETEQ